jgi:dihydroorotase
MIDLPTMIERMSCAPARAFSLQGGTLTVDSIADLTLFDPTEEWVVKPELFLSMSRNTPFAGRKLRGRAAVTIVDGAIVWRAAGR